MGRELRHVPANWEHPKYTADTASRREQIGQFIPLHDDHDKALADFAKDIKKLGLKRAIDDHCGGPQSDEYANCGKRKRTWIQVYETVSEGTPVTPPFATKELLVAYLVEHGDFWQQNDVKANYRARAGWSPEAAKAFVKSEWAPSMIMSGCKLYQNAEGLVAP